MCFLTYKMLIWFFFFLFIETVSHYIVLAGQVGLKLTEVCLPLSLEFWDYRCGPYVAQASLELIIQP